MTFRNSLDLTSLIFKNENNWLGSAQSMLVGPKAEDIPSGYATFLFAVTARVVIAALVFAWDSALRIRARKFVDDKGVKHYEIFGPLFFGSIAAFHEKFEPHSDPTDVIVNFKESRVVDHSAIEALNQLTERYSKVGKRICLKHLGPDCVKLLVRAGSMVEVNVFEDPVYTVTAEV